jgi:hypothetical protein
MAKGSESISDSVSRMERRLNAWIDDENNTRSNIGRLQELGRYLNSQSRERGASDYEQAMGDAANMLWEVIGDP